MGKDVVYLPCYNQHGSLMYAGKPFLLNAKGDNKKVDSRYRRELDKDHIDIDLGDEYRITSVCFAPYFEDGLKKEVSFELFYWNNGWRFFGKQNGSDKHVIFKVSPKVPYSC